MDAAVTLVIDDGPSDATELLLSALKEGGHRAVLFIVGAHLARRTLRWYVDKRARREVLVRAVRRGFALGNHSFDHPHFSTIDYNEARTSIQKTEEIIDDIYSQACVRRPGKWFRFPYLDTGGDLTNELQGLLRDLGFERPPSVGSHFPDQDRVDWPSTLLTRDWELPSESEFRERLRKARPGEIIEIHDFPRTIDRYRRPLVEELQKLSLRAEVP